MSTGARSLEEALRHLGSRLEVWEVRALFLGAQASTDLRFGPEHLLAHLFDGQPVLGDAIKQGNSDLQVILATWNALVSEHRRRRVRLSQLQIGEPPSKANVVALAGRRAGEIAWFVRGIDAGGDDAADFGEEGREILRRLRELGTLCTGMRIVARNERSPRPAAVSESIGALVQTKTTTESLIARLLTIGGDVRRRRSRSGSRRRAPGAPPVPRSDEP